MFHAGDLVDNPVTGQRILICKTERDTQGAYVEVEHYHQAFAGKNYSPRHFHPTWTERFEILSWYILSVIAVLTSMAALYLFMEFQRRQSTTQLQPTA